LISEEVVPIRFANCILDLDARRLFRGSREVHLSPKAFELLKLLVESRPRALAKNDLFERVWPGVFVSDVSLAKIVNEIRTGTGDTARRPRIIRTVHGYGYAFVADVVEDARSTDRDTKPTRARCWLVCGRRVYPLPDGEHIIGREPDADVWLDSPRVSRRHARLTVSGALVTIEDLSSKNGTSVSGTRISTPLTLESKDKIVVGPFTLVLRVGMEGRSTETALSSQMHKTVKPS
jgi:DNA-binding winged helix-turn-helix (wHTH) protein